jgi:hypothetical protein
MRIINLENKRTVPAVRPLFARAAITALPKVRCHVPRGVAAWSGEAEAVLKPFIAKYGERREGEPERLDKALLVQRSQGGFDLLRDLHDLWLLVNESMMSLMVLEQAARALRDQQLLDTLEHMQNRNERQQMWLKTRISQAAPQVLLVPISG